MPATGFLPRHAFAGLLTVLTEAGYRVLGPQARDGAIVYDRLADVDDLPRGVAAHQEPGRYRLEGTAGPRWFAWANGPQALKPLLFAPSETLWRVERDAHGRLEFRAAPPAAEPLAVIGVRACDLAALALNDLHFRDAPVPDPSYCARRDRLFVVAVHCSHPAATCFCASTGDGPRAERGFDLALSELDDGFLVEVGSPAGAAMGAKLPLTAASAAQQSTADAEIDAAARTQTRRLPARRLRDVLYGNLEHDRWREVAQRCLACGNCTSVCPTCFCHDQHQETGLDGRSGRQLREWGSCFTHDHSYIHGLVVRAGTRERYRQWLTHKLGGWHDQYGRSGCVGCGRCIAWCPVGIDLTEEAAAIAGATTGSP